MNGTTQPNNTLLRLREATPTRATTSQNRPAGRRHASPQPARPNNLETLLSTSDRLCNWDTHGTGTEWKSRQAHLQRNDHAATGERNHRATPARKAAEDHRRKTTTQPTRSTHSGSPRPKHRQTTGRPTQRHATERRSNEHTANRRTPRHENNQPKQTKKRNEKPQQTPKRAERRTGGQATRQDHKPETHPAGTGQPTPPTATDSIIPHQQGKKQGKTTRKGRKEKKKRPTNRQRTHKKEANRQAPNEAFSLLVTSFLFRPTFTQLATLLPDWQVQGVIAR